MTSCERLFGIRIGGGSGERSRGARGVLQVAGGDHLRVGPHRLGLRRRGESLVQVRRLKFLAADARRPALRRGHEINRFRGIDDANGGINPLLKLRVHRRILGIDSQGGQRGIDVLPGAVEHLAAALLRGPIRGCRAGRLADVRPVRQNRRGLIAVGELPDLCGQLDSAGGRACHAAGGGVIDDPARGDRLVHAIDPIELHRGRIHRDRQRVGHPGRGAVNDRSQERLAEHRAGFLCGAEQAAGTGDGHRLLRRMIRVGQFRLLDRLFRLGELIRPIPGVISGLRQLGEALVGRDVDRARADQDVADVAGARLAGAIGGGDGERHDVSDLEVQSRQVEVECAFDPARIPAQAQRIFDGWVGVHLRPRRHLRHAVIVQRLVRQRHDLARAEPEIRRRLNPSHQRRAVGNGANVHRLLRPAPLHAAVAGHLQLIELVLRDRQSHLANVGLGCRGHLEALSVDFQSGRFERLGCHDADERLALLGRFDKTVGVMNAERAAAGIGGISVADAKFRHDRAAEHANGEDRRGRVAGGDVIVQVLLDGGNRVRVGMLAFVPLFRIGADIDHRRASVTHSPHDRGDGQRLVFAHACSHRRDLDLRRGNGERTGERADLTVDELGQVQPGQAPKPDGRQQETKRRHRRAQQRPPVRKPRRARSRHFA